MTSHASKLLAEALGLSDSDRADLAARLIDSLDSEFDENAEVAWKEEIGRRINDIDEGKAKLIPWPEARRLILGSGNGEANG